MSDAITSFHQSSEGFEVVAERMVVQRAVADAVEVEVDGAVACADEGFEFAVHPRTGVSAKRRPRSVLGSHTADGGNVRLLESFAFLLLLLVDEDQPAAGAVAHGGFGNRSNDRNEAKGRIQESAHVEPAIFGIAQLWMGRCVGGGGR